MRAGKRSSQRGFTLIELLITMAVAIILATIAVPSFMGMMANSRVASDYNEVISGLNYARSEAVKRRARVQFDATSNGSWQYQVSVVDGDILRSRSGRDNRVSLSEGAVIFNSLGRRESCTAPNECVFSISSSVSNIADRKAQVSMMGRVGKRPETDSEEAEN